MMKLYWSATSPFVRKVAVALIELGLDGEVERVPTNVLPTEPNATLASDNPLMKLPTLVLADGEVLFDSRTILEYLDARSGGRLIPATGPARWAALRRQATADGLLDAAVLLRYETVLRTDAGRLQAWIDGQTTKMHQALAAMEREAASLEDRAGLAEIAIACALGYLDFRFPEMAWGAQAPGLANFAAAFARRRSMQETEPKG